MNPLTLYVHPGAALLTARGLAPDTEYVFDLRCFADAGGTRDYQDRTITTDATGAAQARWTDPAFVPGTYLGSASRKNEAFTTFTSFP